uniref:Conserved oligomeric Golgi complex subunit 6 n=1 Tax=Phallusia mammillata TaxID=59560 RepID=A0A6F9D914_9ASCI|nr:conserved oligomeric Golgi complex subunit 6 [Phallusia mammillata]
MEESVGSLQQGNHPLSKKLKKILDTRLDNDKDMIEALKTVSTFFTDNNIRTRRNLRGEIERRSLLINQQFVDAFSHVVKDLELIHADVQSMTVCCKDMTDRLSATKEQTQELITMTSDLKSEEQRLQVHSDLAQAFLDRFQLKPNEMKVFHGTRDGHLDPGFFAVLEKVQKIHADVKVLLRTNQQTAGLEIMEQMALQQESAYERLYRWSQSQCRSLTSDAIDITPIQQQAMKALQNRPVLFSYTLDEYSTARRGAVVRGFIDALTRGIPSGPPGSPTLESEKKIQGPKPIELHAHDPMRYVGDMLAWLHQASASEKENITQLLSECEKSTEDANRDTLAHVLEGACRPLKVRVEQVLVSEPGTLTLYKLTNLLKFYHDTIRDIIGKACENISLLETINDMYILCRKLFFNSLQYLASKLLDKVELPPSDLSPPRTLNDTIHLLRDIFDSHDSSILPAAERHTDLVQVMTQVLDPLLQMCAMSASQLQPADMAAYVINCMHSIKFMLSLYEFTDQKIEMLSAQIDAHLDTLVNEQAASILMRGGLANVYKTILKHEHDTGPLSKLAGLDRSAMTSAFQHFDDVIHSPDESVLPQVSMLASATLKEVASSRANELVSSAYKVVYDVFTNEKNGYDSATFTVKTPDQIRLLLC